MEDASVLATGLRFPEGPVALADGSVLVVELDEADDETSGAFDDLEGEGSELLSDGDLELAAESLEPGNSALLLVWENTWAARMVHALRDADFRLLAHERIPADAVAAAVATGQG